MPRNIAPGRAHWDYYGPAMISRMLDLVESVQALMQADRAVDGAVLVRVLYEHVVKFCWISIDPTTNYDRWRDDARRWDTKLMNDAIGLGVAPGVVADANQFNQLPDTAQQADQIERHWGAQDRGIPKPYHRAAGARDVPRHVSTGVPKRQRTRSCSPGDPRRIQRPWVRSLADGTRRGQQDALLAADRAAIRVGAARLQ